MTTRSGDSSSPPPDQPSMWIEGDVLVARILGAVGVEDTKRMIEMGEQLYARHGYVLVLMDSKHSKGMTPDARKLSAERLKRFIRPSHTALYHVNGVIRAMSSMMQRGIELIAGKTYPVSFHKDEAEARAHLATQRQVLRAALPSTDR